jgi:DNA-directed RNA polymerase subunit F
MILEKTPLSLAEVKEYTKSLEDNKQIQDYLKKFTKLNMEKSFQLKEKIIKLNNPKIKYDNLVKILDILPKNQEELNKIFTEVSLSEEETNAILEITKEQ